MPVISQVHDVTSGASSKVHWQMRRAKILTCVYNSNTPSHTGSFFRNGSIQCFHRPISWWNRVWMSGRMAAGHCATRRPCGLQSQRITLWTAASPTPAGVIRRSTHKPSPPPPTCHPVISATHEAVISSVRASHSFAPWTKVMNPQGPNSCPHVVPDWLLRPNSDTIYCLGFCSLFRFIMWFHCHVNRVWSRQAFDWHKRRVTHLVPWHWKIKGDRKQVMAHWEKRGNLLTVTFLLNVAWRRRINTEQRQSSWMENHFI